MRYIRAMKEVRYFTDGYIVFQANNNEASNVLINQGMKECDEVGIEFNE